MPQNDTEAVSWYRKAAAQGNAAAQFNLGMMYQNGEGVLKDPVLAYMWFSLSAARGKSNAVTQRDNLAKSLTRAQLAEAQLRPAGYGGQARYKKTRGIFSTGSFSYTPSPMAPATGSFCLTIPGGRNAPPNYAGQAPPLAGQAG